MIEGLIGGKLHSKPVKRTGNNGNTFITAKVRTATTDKGAIYVDVIAFAEDVCSALLALDAGDSVALTGSLTPKVWKPPQGEPRPSLDMVASGITTPYHVTRKREAAISPRRTGKFQSRRVQGDDGLDDDLPWGTEGGAA